MAWMGLMESLLSGCYISLRCGIDLRSPAAILGRLAGNQAARYRGGQLRPLGSNPHTLTGAGFRDRTGVSR